MNDVSYERTCRLILGVNWFFRELQIILFTNVFLYKGFENW